MEEQVVGDNVDPIVSEKKDAVAYETYKKVLSQRKADQEKIRLLETVDQRARELEAENQKLLEEKHKIEGNWKALLETREQKLKTLEEELQATKSKTSQYEQHFVEASKLQAFNDALGGKLKHQTYYNLVDTSKIPLNPETGEIDNEGLKEYVNSFYQEHKDLVALSKPKITDRAPVASTVNVMPKGANEFKDALKNALTKK